MSSADEKESVAVLAMRAGVHRTTIYKRIRRGLSPADVAAPPAKRGRKPVRIDGRTVAEIASAAGVSGAAVYSRISRGVPADRLQSPPYAVLPPKVDDLDLAILSERIAGPCPRVSMTDLGSRFGVSRQAVQQRELRLRAMLGDGRITADGRVAECAVETRAPPAREAR